MGLCIFPHNVVDSSHTWCEGIIPCNKQAICRSQQCCCLILISRDFMGKSTPAPSSSSTHSPIFNTFLSDSVTSHFYRDGQRTPRRRKVLDYDIMESGILQTRNAPTKKYGLGKGLMPMLRATTFNNFKRSSAVIFVNGSADLLDTSLLSRIHYVRH